MFTIYISRKSRDKREVIVKIFIFLFAHLNILLPFPLREKTQHMFPDKNFRNRNFTPRRTRGRIVVSRRDFLCKQLLLNSLLVLTTVQILSTTGHIGYIYIFVFIV